MGKDCDFPQSMGVIIETPGFIPYYSGYKNLKLLAELRGKIGGGEIKNTMHRVGLDPELKRPVRKYSLGMRQRLGLAQEETINLTIKPNNFFIINLQMLVFLLCTRILY